MAVQCFECKKCKEMVILYIESLEDGWHYRNGIPYNGNELCESCNKKAYNTETGSESKLIEELRTTKRTLWLARARTAELQWGILEETFPISMREEIGKWQWVERKCREKAEEYK